MLENLFVLLVCFGFVHIYSCMSYVSKSILTFLVKIQLSIKNAQQEKGKERPKEKKRGTRS